MILVHKNVGETPLELLERIRREKPELAKETLSYAGRLDPMAEGQMLVLVGRKENKDRQKFLDSDKEYVATFLVGVKTDTGDCLGLVEKTSKILVGEISKANIEKRLENLKKIKEQKYPWFSGRAVKGIKLFDHFKAGNTDIERPSRNVEIREIELIDFSEQKTEEVKSYIFDSIGKVSGDFRQEKILATWSQFFGAHKNQKMETFEVRVLVSSGTYIRALTENFDFPVTLLKLNRTKIDLPIS